MITIYDYATNAACPQRPTWRVSAVGYEWARAVFGDCKQHRTSDIKKGMEAVTKLKKTRRNILFISHRHAGKLSWMSVF